MKLIESTFVARPYLTSVVAECRVPQAHITVCCLLLHLIQTQVMSLFGLLQNCLSRLQMDSHNLLVHYDPNCTHADS